MSSNQTFDPKRFWNLLRMEMYRSRKGIFMAVEISLGFLFAMGIVLENLIESSNLYDSFPIGYSFTLLIGGFALSSMAFNELGNSLKRYNFLMLPVSAFERFLAMWLLTTVGWVVIYTFTFILYSLIAARVGHFLFSHITFVPFDPFGPIAVNTIKYYLVIQGVFLVGASQFKGYVFPKTIFTLVLVMLVCMMLHYLIMWGFDGVNDEVFSDPAVWATMSVYKVWIGVQYVFWWVLGPLCWVLTYLGLKDQEV